MLKTFNTAGPSVQGEHYMIDPLARIDLEEVETLIARGRYFVLHAPRQTGKTTALLALMHHLNAQGKYQACYANIEGAQTARQDVALGIRTICGAIESSAKRYLEDGRLHAWTEEAWAAGGANGALTGLLERWSAESERPLVLMLDEVDALVGDTLISLLRQIRAGYPDRPKNFPQTVILCGVRDVRDYRIHTADREIVTGGSAFNIKTKSLRLGNLTREETESLWRQHEKDTCQVSWWMSAFPRMICSTWKILASFGASPSSPFPIASIRRFCREKSYGLGRGRTVLYLEWLERAPLAGNRKSGSPHHRRLDNVIKSLIEERS